MQTPQRVALVTGGNRGLGFETARQLAAQGIRVVLHTRKRSAGGGRAARRLAGAGFGDTSVVAEGAATVVWLTMLPDDGPSGGFFRDRQPIPW